MSVACCESQRDKQVSTFESTSTRKEKRNETRRTKAQTHLLSQLLLVLLRLGILPLVRVPSDPSVGDIESLDLGSSDLDLRLELAMTDVVVHVLPVLVGEVDFGFDPFDGFVELLDSELRIGDLVLLLGDVLVELLESFGSLGVDPPAKGEKIARESVDRLEEFRRKR